MSRVSVIVPVYRVEAYIHRCINSILVQTYSDFELILVDDGSPDNCGVICDEYARQDSRIHVIHQQNGGLSAARNAGIAWVISHSESQWITFLDSDDWIHREYLQILLEAAQQNNVQISMCGLSRVSCFCEEKQISHQAALCMDAESAYRDYYGMCMTVCCKIYHKSLWTDIRFPEGKLHEDCYTTHLPLFASAKVAVCDVPLYYYFANPGSITRIKWSEKRLQELEAHEVRAAWLKDHGYEAACRRETEVYVMTIYEHTEALAKLVRKDDSFRHHLVQLRRKLRASLNDARKQGLYAFEMEYLWIYVMSYAGVSVWYFLQDIKKLRKIKKSGTEI